MGSEQQIKYLVEYVDVEVVKSTPVKKHVWDGEKFVPITLRRVQELLSPQEIEWLTKTIGPAGVYKINQYWDYSRSGNFTIMDDKIYAWYCMKWGTK